jgi:hypothetical protein
MKSMNGPRIVLGTFLAATAIGLLALTAWPAEAQRGRGALGTVYVSSQGLYYDTFVAAERLPPHGKFQLLVDNVTEFGPGDPGYLGGRWKVPNDSGGYDYFLCPLLPPGRSQP